MLLTSDKFASLLSSLSLTQGLFKPVPELLDSGFGSVLSPTVAPSTSISSSTIPTNKSSLGFASKSHPGSALPISFIPTQVLDQSGDCTVQPYNAPDIPQKFVPFDQTRANVFRYRQQQSVNLGSWFVHESWMTPSLYRCAAGKKISELDIASGWGSTDAARTLLEKHWDSFITQADFDYLANIGINTVRLPIGYWSLGPAYCQDTPFAQVADVYQNAWSRVVNAIIMADKANIGVLVDLHGAPGSQNGQPHSGISDGQTNLFDDPSNINKTIGVLSFLMQQLAYVSNVVGIQILNEPQNVPSLPDFYTQAITAMRQITPEGSSFPLYLHDGFDLERFSDYIASRTDFVVEDHHSYFVFTSSDAAESASDHSADVQSSIAGSLAAASAKQRRNLVVDEWSCALTAQSLSGEADRKQAQESFCTDQMNVYAGSTAGWAFWSYTKEDCQTDPGWCFKAAVGNTLPSSFFSYSGSHSGQALTHAQGSADNTTSMSSTSQLRQSASHDLPPLLKRFVTIHDRRTNSSSPRRDDSFNINQHSVNKGYSDGYLTAMVFGTYEGSKLGFVGQYVDDSRSSLGGSVIVPGTEGYYADWFLKGLADGEAFFGGGLTQL
ncbi:glycoside hydrolase family 5 protein [Jaapia argillacea MUCL 33604]|uniref:Glycoside hydrolase family 5 protein n=1 Tax=Jaapia argillacea MUCL 33604 TaxID=933084 RepID=A0A067Q183_9AGAM|nr:glycoside hydrolase family 5 protein [Jaapia argillacea MUCL 33604]